MSSAKALLGAVAGRFLFREAKVTSSTWRSKHFIQLEVEGNALTDARFVPGDKVQVFLPGEGMRTYTPLEWAGPRTSFLGFVHGDAATPGTTWLRNVKGGDRVQLFGPRRSIDTSQVSGDVVVIGDETSLALSVAVTRAFPSRKVSAVLEAHDVDELKTVASGLGVTLEARAFGDSKGLFEMLCARIDAGATPLFTGRAATLQALKQSLRAANRSVGGLTKAYWAEGKRGLD